jgi:hypothetical protein
MGHKVLVSPKAGCVFTWLYDTVTDGDLDAILSQIRSAPGFQPTFNEFVDLSLADSFQVTSIRLEGAGHACSSLFSPPAKRVILAQSDIAYGISRMFQAFADRESEPVYVVRSKSEACSLLKLEESALPQLDAA